MVQNDFRYAARLMRRTPLFTLTVVLTVSLAIAANTAIFTVVNAILIKPLPYQDPDRLVQVAEKNDKLNLPNFGSSVLNFVSWRQQAQSFEQLAAVGFGNYTLTGSGEAEQLAGNQISPALNRVLGIPPIAGRAFLDEEEKPGAAPVAMIAEGLWKRRFGADRGLLGRTIILNGTPTTVVGIAPAALNLISGGEVYVPMTIDPSKEIRLNHIIFTLGRLKPGVSIEQAQAEMNTVSARLGQQYPEIRDWGIHLLTLSETFVARELKTRLLVLMWAVVLVLLIACVNIANLLLARSAVRQSEIAIRTAIGASRSRLIRQLLVESVLLSLLGGVGGICGAFWAVRIINHSLPANTLPIPVIEIDARVLGFAFVLTIATGLIFGLMPAWRTAKTDINGVLKQAGRGSTSRISGRLRDGLAATELAMATVLLIGAGLFTRSLLNLQNVRLGFAPQGLLTFQLSPPATKYPPNSKAPQLYRALLDSLQSIPGARGAAVSSGIPFGAGAYNTHPMLTTDTSALPPGTKVPIDWRIVSPGYFKTMGIPLLQGREFTDADGPAPAPPVMIVSQATAKKFWGNANPLGHSLRRSANPATAFTIVGVVGDVRSTALNQESPALYYPMASRVWPVMDVVVRTDGSPEALLPIVRQRIHDLDPELALANVSTMEQWLSNSAAQPRLSTALLAAFALVALLIASIGIYGVLAYSVSQRTGEIGVRMAMGATRQNVLQQMVLEGMRLGMIGIGIGVVVALAAGRAISSLIFGVQARDLPTYLTVTVALAIVALAACAIPALRASRVDPLQALRYE
ncbi:MAG TPA: ABC transporter permease [Candidatus Sulfotelmatobacter sp.]|nr:ABC transporter permease [Candidatus Sulfotelmatobacter sp.]